MSTFRWLIIPVLFLIVVQPSFADDREKFLGIWKIVSWETEFQATGEREPVLGKNPTGYIIFTPEGRMMTVITGEGRKEPKTDQDRADLLKSLIAYTGMYRLDGDKFITKVDVAWNPAWNGTDQVRFFRLEGDRLYIISAWQPNPLLTNSPITRGFLTWKRLK